MKNTPNNSQRSEWTGIDFQINKAFWSYWGHDAAVPLRIRNLRDLQSVFRKHRIPCSLYGSTLLQAQQNGWLRPDHDDDLCVAAQTFQMRQVLSDLVNEGFTIIRESSGLYSFERFGRYLDTHLVPIASFKTSLIRVNGTDLEALPLSHQIIAAWAAQKKVSVKRTFGSSVQNSVQKKLIRLRTLKSPRDFARLCRRLINRFSKTRSRFLHGIRNPRVSVALSKVEFLRLRIDDPGALNWSWRGAHWRAAFRPGETFGEALKRYSEEGVPRGTSQDLQLPLLEPIHLSRAFWKNGSDNLTSQLRHGFKHQVMPYRASNLYIVNGLQPPLFTDDYFAELPSMTDDEIARFLKDHPLEISKGRNLSSGRHRATAMVGHLLHGRPYVKVHVRCSLSTSMAILSKRAISLTKQISTRSSPGEKRATARK